MHVWVIRFKNGESVNVRGGDEVRSAADPSNGATVLKDRHGNEIVVNSAEVLYAQQLRRA